MVDSGCEERKLLREVWDAQRLCVILNDQLAHALIRSLNTCLHVSNEYSRLIHSQLALYLKRGDSDYELSRRVRDSCSGALLSS